MLMSRVPVLELAETGDLKAILGLESLAFPRAWGKVAWEAELENPGSRVYCLWDSRTLIGLIAFRMILDEMHLMKIAVAPNRRRGGMGSRLLAEGLDQARQMGAKYSLLEVRPSNRAALHFYRKFGFQGIGKRPGYYPETGEDALILAKRL